MIKILDQYKRKNPALYRDIVSTIKVMSPLVVLLGLGLVFNEFVMEAMEKDLAIAGTILGVAGYGSILILLRLRSAQIDFRTIERFGQEARDGVPMKQILEEPWIRYRYVRHYLKHIALTDGNLSSQLDQNAIESELHALQEDYNSKLEFPQFLVGFMIALGLLGTFIGLLATLTGISGMLGSMGASDGLSPDQQFKELIVELRKPLAGMGIAFSASMFGLVTSLGLAIMMTNLRSFISRVVMCARNVMHDLIQIAPSKPASAKDDDAHSGQTFPAGVIMAAEQSEAAMSGMGADGSLLLISRLDLMIKKMDAVNKSFEASITNNARLNDLLGFGPRMKETSERSLEEFRAMVQITQEQQRILQQMLDSQGGSGRHLWEIKESMSKFDSLSSNVEMIASSIAHQSVLFEALAMELRGLKGKL